MGPQHSSPSVGVFDQARPTTPRTSRFPSFEQEGDRTPKPQRRQAGEDGAENADDAFDAQKGSFLKKPFVLPTFSSFRSREGDEGTSRSPPKPGEIFSRRVEDLERFAEKAHELQDKLESQLAQLQKRSGVGRKSQGAREVHVNILQDIVRIYTAHWLGIQPDPDSYINGKSCLPPPPQNPDRQQPVLSRPLAIAYESGLGHPYNQHLAGLLAEALIEEPEYQWFQLTQSDKGAIIQAFLVHFVRLREVWRLQDKGVSRQEMDKLRSKQARSKRRRDLAKARLKTAESALPDHADIIQTLGPDGASSDEETEQLEVFNVKRKDWRAPELKRLLHILDQLALAKRKSKQKGRPPRQRIYPPSSEKDWNTSSVIHGLPRNAYDPEWLKTLTSWEYKIIDPSDEVWDFNLPSWATDYLARAADE